MKKITFMSAFFTALLLVASCGGDDDNGPGDGGGQGGGNNAATSKQKIEQIGIELANSIDVNSLKPVRDLINEFGELYGDYEFPFDGNSEEPTPRANRIGNITKMVDNMIAGERTQLSKEVLNFDIYSEYSSLWGNYAVDKNKGCWTLISSSTTPLIKLNFNNRANEMCHISISASENYSEVTIDEDGETIVVKVPNTIEVKLVQGSKTLASLVVKSVIKLSSKTASVNVSLLAGDYTWNEKLDLSDTRCTNSFEMLKQKSKLLDFKTTITGNKLTNTDSYTGDAGPDISTGTSELSVLGKMAINVNVPNYKKLVAVEENFSNGPNTDTDEGWINYANEVNNNLDARITLNGATLCNIKMKMFKEVDYNYEATRGVNPVMSFSDGTTYKFDDYFNQKDFGNLLTKFSSVLEDLENFFGN